LAKEYNLLEKINFSENYDKDHFENKRLDKIDKVKFLELKNVLALELLKTMDEDKLTPPTDLYTSFVDEKVNNFWKELDMIHIDRPTKIIRVSHVINDIIEMIDILICKGYAYESHGSVYFDTQKYHQDFNKCLLEPSNDDDVSIKNEHNIYKKHNHDFALWKKADPRAVSFNSKWSKGNVGWHIECSLISNKMFGDTIDLHGGGIDLKFPHHHNEVLQSDSFNNKNTFKHFTYVGHVCVNGDKMAQSDGNFITLEDYLKSHTPNSIRLLFWMMPWESSAELHDEIINQAAILEKRIMDFITSSEHYIEIFSNNSEINMNLIRIINHKFSEVNNHLSLNFRTHLVITDISDIITTTNKLMKDNEIDKTTLINIIFKLKKIFWMIGMEFDNKSSVIVNDNAVAGLNVLRDNLRNDKLYKYSDYIRDELFPIIGCSCQDTGSGYKVSTL
jgi:cysteinyl-tRNA synthetase